MKKWWHWFYLSEAAAREYGFTHEGIFFGMPAWLIDDGTGETFIACPKVTLLQLVALLLDQVLQFGSLFIPEDKELVTPVTIIRKLT
jgi:hypothetical protein